ncbi:hypothetical protein SELMODRAFT_408542 [Selaginella moellendorffii]|uniref:ABC transmembrane type-1 domain-containing protein n=1 Tax=Selaginella moellendorffii TaxID=88036 RepID=D8R8M4_SELML|nr:hypothetical protein SELMODRAFT_408542 [Selaginella moellendorffii]
MRILTYLQKLEALRGVEYGWLKKSFLSASGQMITGVVTFGTCVVLKIPLTTGKVLSAVATFRILQEASRLYFNSVSNKSFAGSAEDDSCGLRKIELALVPSGRNPKTMVQVTGRTSYVGQTAWVQSGPIENNVCFGSPMDRSKYDRVLEMCQLKRDLEVLPFGNQIEIGERGVNLSGVR